MKWEYYELATADVIRGFSVEQLSQAGSERWELVAIYERGGPLGIGLRQLVAVFKRPAPQQSAEVGR